MNGTQLQQYNLTGKGKQTVTINSNSFQPGMYLYALVIDGREVDTKMGYSLQANVKGFEASAQHPDRNEQFHYINTLATSYITEKQPVISVDTKKKELVGNYKNGGKEYRPKKDARQVKLQPMAVEATVPG